MSADNYYLVRHHPLGGYAVVMGFASDEEYPKPKVTTRKFTSFNEAVEYASEQHAEYGAIIHPEIRRREQTEEFQTAFADGRASFERELAASGKVVVDRELLARLTDYANDLGAYALPGTWALIRTDYEATLAVLTTPDGAPDV